MRFQDDLKNARERNGFSQEKLAELMDVSRQTVSKWETGEALPSMNHIFMLAKILNCNFSELICENAPRRCSKTTLSRRTLGCIFVAMFLIVSGIILVKHSQEQNFQAQFFNHAVKVLQQDIFGRDDVKIIGYGVRESDQDFFVKCSLEGEEGPCTAIVYFCKNGNGFSYNCEYVDETEYWPMGEHYYMS